MQKQPPGAPMPLPRSASPSPLSIYLPFLQITPCPLFPLPAPYFVAQSTRRMPPAISLTIKAPIFTTLLKIPKRKGTIDAKHFIRRQRMSKRTHNELKELIESLKNAYKNHTKTQRNHSAHPLWRQRRGYSSEHGDESTLSSSS